MAALDYDQLLQAVEMTAGVDRAAAERAVEATLTTLAERIGREEFDQLAARLPNKFRETPWQAGPDPEPFPPEEFVRRTARRIGTDERSAWDRARAVLATLRQSLAEMEQVRTRLQDYDPLMS
jgi:uncharacterized protein (DUF2267 family)